MTAFANDDSKWSSQKRSFLGTSVLVFVLVLFFSMSFVL